MKNKFISVSEYILSLFLLILYLINYQVRQNSFLFLAVGSVLFVSLFYVCYQKVKNFPIACIMMLCHTWQISWFNIFGQPSVALQMPWFYVIGAILFLYALYNVRSFYTKPVSLFFLATLVTVIVTAVIPLLNSPSKAEGLKEYIMIMFYVVLIFVAFMLSETAKEGLRKHIFDSYVWCVFISCFFLVFQSVVFYVSGIKLFYHSEGVYFGNATVTSGLLMGDLSSATIMLGSGVWICLSRIEQRKKLLLNILVIVVIIIGMALTSRRTSTISLLLTLAIYTVVHYKKQMKKVLAVGAFFILGLIMLYFIQYSRPVDDISLYLYDNERFDNYIRVFQTLRKHPLGVGYDSVYSAAFMLDGIQPHNAFLRWLFMGGPLLAVPLTVLPLYTLFLAYKKKLTTEFWIILYSLLAANFIPDILTARFFIIPCVCVFILPRIDNKKEVSHLKHNGAAK